MIKELIFGSKKWFSPNGLVINADGLDYYAIPYRIRIAKGTKISVVDGQLRDGEESGGDAWLQADVIGVVDGVTAASITDGIKSTFMFALDSDYRNRVGLLKNEHGENIYDFDILHVDCDKCQIISGK